MNGSDAERVARAVAELASVLDALGYRLYDYPAGGSEHAILWGWARSVGIGEDSQTVAHKGGYSGSRAALGGAADDAIARWRAQSLGQEATK